MSFFIDHPAQWIGVPDFWPFPSSDGVVFDTPEQWSVAVADALTASGDLSVEARARLIELLLMSSQRSIDAQSRTFITFEDWEGSAFVVESVTRPRRHWGDAPIESLAGRDDPAQLGPVFSEDFLTASGLSGVRCFRYLPYDNTGVIFGRADYVFEQEDEVITLTGAEIDLVFFEKVKTLLEGLAATVRWVETRSS